MKFRVLAGKHVANGRVWMRGQVVETESNLARFNDQSVMRQKFERLPDEVTADPGTPIDQVTDPGYKPASDETVSFGVDIMSTYESMSVDELRRVAAEEEIDLGRAKNKSDILAALKAALTTV